jgi:hypothetical protein
VNVVFVALGGTRRPAVVRECARVRARGGTATVVVGEASAWADEPLPDGVETVELSALERRHRPVPERFRPYRRPARRHRRDPAAIRRRAVDRGLLRGRSVDLVVVGDAQSLVTVAELADVLADAGARPAYTIAGGRSQ